MEDPAKLLYCVQSAAAYKAFGGKECWLAQQCDQALTQAI